MACWLPSPLLRWWAALGTRREHYRYSPVAWGTGHTSLAASRNPVSARPAQQGCGAGLRLPVEVSSACRDRCLRSCSLAEHGTATSVARTHGLAWRSTSISYRYASTRPSKQRQASINHTNHPIDFLIVPPRCQQCTPPFHAYHHDHAQLRPTNHAGAALKMLPLARNMHACIHPSTFTGPRSSVHALTHQPLTQALRPWRLPVQRIRAHSYVFLQLRGGLLTSGCVCALSCTGTAIVCCA